MMRRFLKETPGGSARSLSVGRHQVHDSWDQIQAYLSSALSPAHAALFAEPFRSGGAISWMAATDAEPLPFARLEPEDQEQLLARLQDLLADISRFAAERNASGGDEGRQWGALLEAIQQQPAGVPLIERLFAAEGQPVLIQWGCRDDATVATGTLLHERLAAAPKLVPTAGAGASGAVTPAGATALVAGGMWLPLLLWLLFVATLALIFWWLLAACALNLPPSMRLFGQCHAVTVSHTEEQRQADLLARLQSLRGDLGTADQCRVHGGPQTVWRAPRATPPAMRPEPPVDEGRTAPEALPRTPPDTQRSDTDLDRAREQAGGTVGDVTVTLLWNGRSDLDLLVVCPTGQTVSGARSQGQVFCGGTVDVDANFCASREAGAGSACQSYKNSPIDNPVESGFFNREGGQAGEFLIRVRHYAAATGAPGLAVPYVLQLRRGDVRQRFEGTLQPGEAADITTFRFD